MQGAGGSGWMSGFESEWSVQRPRNKDGSGGREGKQAAGKPCLSGQAGGGGGCVPSAVGRLLIGRYI